MERDFPLYLQIPAQTFQNRAEHGDVIWGQNKQA